MIAAISPADINFEETLSTLRYYLNVPKINNVPVLVVVLVLFCVVVQFVLQTIYLHCSCYTLQLHVSDRYPWLIIFISCLSHFSRGENRQRMISILFLVPLKVTVREVGKHRFFRERIIASGLCGI